MAEVDKHVHYPPLTEDLQGGLSFKSLKYFGAGAIIASVTIGSGETFFASRGGAIFGYAVLWFLAVSAIAKGVMVYTAARHFTLTGTHPMTHWGAMPGPRNWVPWTFASISLLCFPFWIAGLPIFLGKAINWMLGMEDMDPKIWGVIIIVMAGGLTLIQSYGALEKFQTGVVSLLLVSMLVAAFVCNPDWMAVLKGLTIPQFPSYPDWFIDQEKAKAVASGVAFNLQPAWVEIGLYLGAIGGGTYDYLGYLGCYREKRWGLIGKGDGLDTSTIATDSENIKRGKRWLFPARIDVGVAFFCVLIFTICFTVLGATILGSQQTVPDKNQTLNLQAAFLTNIHPGLKYLYMVGIFMAFWGTIYGAFEIYIRTARECLMPLSAKVRNTSEKAFSRWIVLYCAVGGIALMFAHDDPAKLVAPAAIVGGVFLCGPWCFAMIWADKKFMPQALRMGLGLKLMNLVAGCLLTILGLKAIIDYLMKTFG